MKEQFESFVVKRKYNLMAIKELTKDVRLSVDNLYSEEPFPVFEHSPFHIMSYFLYDHNVYFMKCMWGEVIVGIKDRCIVFFTPKINHAIDFLELLNSLFCELSNTEIKIQNVSKDWIDKNGSYFNKSQTIERSKEEVVYSLSTLINLHGSSFSKLRNTRSRLLNSGLLTFKPLTSKSFEDVAYILNKWQKTQGRKYHKDRFDKELYVIKKFIEFSKLFNSEIFAEVGYIANIPVSYYLMHANSNFSDWATLYALKGLNIINDGGRRGVSDATYCRAFLKAHDKNMNFLNDGELGAEAGTREHKLRFKPIQFLQSYDIVIHDR